MTYVKVNGAQFSKNYPDNLLTLKEQWESGNRPSVWLLNRNDRTCNSSSTVVFCIDAGGVIGYLPESYRDITSNIENGTEYEIVDLFVYSLPEDEVMDHPSLGILIKPQTTDASRLQKI
jgi:hypothetical protein